MVSRTTPSDRHRHPKRAALKLAAGVAVAALTAAASLVPVGAATSPDVALPIAGTCVFNGNASFSPALHLTPAANVTVTISGSGACYGAGIALGEQVTFSPSFTGTEPLASCALGEGSMFGSLDFSTPLPPPYQGGATYIGGPATATVTIVSAALVGTATLVWSNPAAIAACPTSGTASTSLTGLFTFVAP